MEYSEEGGNAALAQRYSVLTRMFLAKLEKAMAELPLMIKPSTEAVTALIIAVSFIFTARRRTTPLTRAVHGCY
jgi:hypothetical protein